jgi:dsRNA-specific ribonuclease
MATIENLESKLKVLYPRRNGVEIDISALVDGVNYDGNTLTYTTPSRAADQIRDTFLKMMQEIGVDNFIVYDICGCTGGSAISFMDSERIKFVMTYEMDLQRVDMLKRNINLYGLGYKSGVYSKPFSTSERIIPGAVLFFDPPWLVGINGVDSQHSDYLQKDIKLGDETLEEFLEAYTENHWLIGFHVPPGYMMKPVKGWTYRIEDIHKSRNPLNRVVRRLIFCTSTAGLDKTVRHSGGMFSYEKNLKTLQNRSTDKWVDPLTKTKSMETASLLGVGQYKVGLTTDLPQQSLPTANVSLPRMGPGGLPLATTQEKIGGSNQPSDLPDLSSILGKVKTIRSTKSNSITPQRMTSGEGDKKVFSRSAPKNWNQKRLDSFKPSFTLVKPKDTEMAEYVPEETQFYKSAAKFPRYTAIGGTLEEITMDWLTQLRMFVVSIMSCVIKDKEMLIQMVNPEAMKIWARAFTHANFDDIQNYESIETMGDGVLKYTFRKLLFRRTPDITDAQISNYDTYYMAKMFQSEMSSLMGFNTWVRMNGVPTRDIIEDLFESFFGAIDMVGDSMREGMGTTISLMFLNYIFKDRVFDPKRASGNPKTIIVQAASRLYWNSTDTTDGVTEHVTENVDNDTYTCEIIFNDVGLTFMKVLGIELTNPIASATRRTHAGAEADAYHKSYDLLYNQGFNFDVSTRLRAELELMSISESNPEYSLLVERVKAKAMAKYGTSNLQFNIDRSTMSKHTTHVDLRIVMDDGTFTTLSRASSQNGSKGAKGGKNSTGKNVRNLLWVKTLKQYDTDNS